LSYIQDENKINNIYNPDRKEGVRGPTGGMDFDCHS